MKVSHLKWMLITAAAVGVPCFVLAENSAAPKAVPTAASVQTDDASAAIVAADREPGHPDGPGHGPPDGPGHGPPDGMHGPHGPKLEKGTFLGVGAGPVSEEVRAQLKLPEGTGLTIHEVAPDSPAEKAGLKKFDVLTKVDDQLIIDEHQLAVLIRMHKAGDEVKLSVVHEATPTTVSAALVEKDLPPIGGEEMGGPGHGPGERGGPGGREGFGHGMMGRIGGMMGAMFHRGAMGMGGPGMRGGPGMGGPGHGPGGFGHGMMGRFGGIMGAIHRHGGMGGPQHREPGMGGPEEGGPGGRGMGMGRWGMGGPGGPERGGPGMERPEMGGREMRAPGMGGPGMGGPGGWMRGWFGMLHNGPMGHREMPGPGGMRPMRGGPGGDDRQGPGEGHGREMRGGPDGGPQGGPGGPDDQDGAGGPGGPGAGGPGGTVGAFMFRGRGMRGMGGPTTMPANFESTVSFTDGDQAITIHTKDGHRTLSVKDKDGKSIFDGPIDTPEERAKLPADVDGKLKAMRGGMMFGGGPRAEGETPDIDRPDTVADNGAAAGDIVERLKERRAEELSSTAGPQDAPPAPARAPAGQ